VKTGPGRHESTRADLWWSSILALRFVERNLPKPSLLLLLMASPTVVETTAATDLSGKDDGLPATTAS
jgi:hypothetical protein